MLARGVVSTSIIYRLGSGPRAFLGQMRAMSIAGDALGRVRLPWDALDRTFFFGHVCVCMMSFRGGGCTIKGTSRDSAVVAQHVHEFSWAEVFWMQAVGKFLHHSGTSC